MSTARAAFRMEVAPRDNRVTSLELFFDPVFVFALTQVTAFMAEDLTGRGILRGVLILAVLWWSWTGYAWLSNVVRADAGVARIASLIAMIAMFVLALTIPEAFEDLDGGLPGPLLVALCYFLFRLMHLLLFWAIASDDQGLRRQLIRFAPSMIGGTALLVAASQYQGTTQTVLWALALVADYGGTYLGGASGWRLRSPGHFSERHGLILIVALGESIVALGVGAAEVPVSWPIVGGSIAGLVLSAALWWAYFDVTALQAEHALAAEPEATRARLARDAYSFLHFPLLTGVVLLALGLKKVLEYVGDTEQHQLNEPLTGIGLYALFGGVVLYLLGHVAFKWRISHFLTVDRLITAGFLTLLIPMASLLPALATLALVAAVLVAAMAFETVHFADQRAQIRHEVATPGHEESPAP